MNVIVKAAVGRADLVYQARWREEDPGPYNAHGLLGLVEDEDEGTARGVWYYTEEDDLILSDELVESDVTEAEIHDAEEQVAIQLVQNAIYWRNYRSFANLLMSMHREARNEQTEFDVICAAAIAEINEKYDPANTQIARQRTP